MERQGFVHPVDASGRRRAFASIPRLLAQLEDDPYRTLAVNVRDNGGCTWEGAAAEILWANFLRLRVPAPVLAANAGEALRMALHRGAQRRGTPPARVEAGLGDNAR